MKPEWLLSSSCAEAAADSPAKSISGLLPPEKSSLLETPVPAPKIAVYDLRAEMTVIAWLDHRPFLRWEPSIELYDSVGGPEYVSDKCELILLGRSKVHFLGGE